jgi:hypothetical protein
MVCWIIGFTDHLKVVTILASIVLLIPLCTDRVDNTVSNSTSIVACVSVAAGTCFPSLSLAAAYYSS